MFGAGVALIPLEIDGPDHAKWRRLLDPLFAPKAVKRLEDGVRDLARELVESSADEWAAGADVDFFERFCVPLPSLTFLRLLGAPVADLDFFIRFKDGVIHPDGDTPEEITANTTAAGMELLTYFGTYLAGRRAETGRRDDLIGRLIDSEVAGEPITDAELLSILFLLMFAGLDTVTSALSCMIAWLAEHPAERHRIATDPALVPAAVEELLRYESPVPSGMRYATVDIDLGDGLVIEQGEAILAFWSAANVDPTAFADPLRVDIDRARHTHIAFASGTHRCLGSHLARLELRVALEELHRRMPDYVLAEPARFANVAVRAAQGLRLRAPRA